MDTAFRKINIDALEEDILLPSDLYDPDPRGPAGVLSDAKSKSAEVRQLVSRWVLAGELGAIGHDIGWLAAARRPWRDPTHLTCFFPPSHRGDNAGALSAILTDPPYGEGVDEAKVRESRSWTCNAASFADSLKRIPYRHHRCSWLKYTCPTLIGARYSRRVPRSQLYPFD
jgi:hypothetical protein